MAEAKRRLLLGFLKAVVLLAALGAALTWCAFWLEARNFIALGPAQSETVVLIKSGTGVSGIARQLASSGAISEAILFELGVRRRGEGGALKAGEYAFPAHASMASILDMLVKGKVIIHRLTIAEGLTSAMAVALIAKDDVLTGETPPEPREGSLLPETYLFERGTTRAELLARMQKAQSAVLDRLWATREAGSPLQTREQAIILASIVEKETAIPSERGHIARVFLNRLQMGIRLESDPTIIYGLTKGVPLGHGLRQSELATPNPYSTYQIDGLPPGPICNPGRDAIAAVLNPPVSDDLYFVADGNGGHVFAATLAEHNRNVARWRQIERERGAAP
jgi:UPF0755 protein